MSEFFPYNVCSCCGNRMCEHGMCRFCEGCDECAEAADEMAEELEDDMDGAEQPRDGKA
jgi:hypothetical protein